MSVESIKVPSERIPPVAKDMSGTSKSVAGVLLFVTAILLITSIAFAMGDTPPEFDRPAPKDSAEAAGEAAGTVIVFGLFAGLPFLFGFRAARNASRATRASKVAASDPSYTWRLSGKYIIAADGAGVPRTEVSFKVNGKIRTMLLALPQAELVQR